MSILSLIPGTAGASPSTIATVAVATTTLLLLGRALVSAPHPKIHPSPLRTVVPRTPKAELEKLVYTPDQFPGGRDVETPYGSIRVYEFGPEDGEKVFLVHGISTSCVVFAPLARALVARGCRVMIYDLFGRGFSDNVGDLPHDPRLYVSQMLLVLASSPLSWTGTAAFKLIGYSLGGGICVHFANAFPHLVSSLVLLAPAGLIDDRKFGLVSRIAFQWGVIPERIVRVLTARRLKHPIAPPRREVHPIAAEPAQELAAAETKGSHAPLNQRVLAYVQWMVANHEGFVPSFMSCVRFAPLTGQHESWRVLGRRQKGTTAVLLGEVDELIDATLYREEGLPLLGGEENVLWKVLPGGHDFVMSESQHIVAELDKLWGMKEV